MFAIASNVTRNRNAGKNHRKWNASIRSVVATLLFTTTRRDSIFGSTEKKKEETAETSECMPSRHNSSAARLFLFFESVMTIFFFFWKGEIAIHHGDTGAHTLHKTKTINNRTLNWTEQEIYSIFVVEPSPYSTGFQHNLVLRVNFIFLSLIVARYWVNGCR